MNPSRPTRTRNAADAARRICAAAAAELVACNGSLEMLAVARRAGVSVGLAYHHFGSKGGLLAAVVDAFRDRYEAEVSKAPLDHIADWATREHERVRRLVAFHYAEPLAPLILGRLAAEPEVAAIEKAYFERQVRRGAWNIAEGQRAGIIPPSQDPGLLVAMVLGGVRAAIATALAQVPRPAPEVLTAQIWTFVASATQLTTRPQFKEAGDGTSSATLRLRHRRKARTA
ncbi:TetR/AcrR family transcriptional regulator [Desertibaculum subflavum]|uniref:TetR/AcrR family transcriptional regulator n=1 Tax=Desertibaculum subflavum TaxID=2268458 RepID=UPI000E667671